MKELPITLVLRPTGYETLATEIWAATGTGSFAKAAGPSLVLVALSVAPTVLLVTRDRRATAATSVDGAGVSTERAVTASR